MKEQQPPAQLFLSYVEEDNAYYELFEKHFSESIRQRTLTLWSPKQIVPGKDIEEEISTHLEQADLILLLFSPDYLADDACYRQLERAIQIGEQEQERVYIILLRPCAWMEIWNKIDQKGHFHILPHSGQAISYRLRSEWDDAAQGIVAELSGLVERMQRTGHASVQGKGPTTPLTPPEEMRNPYLALRSFGIEDEASFYGREEQTAEIQNQITSMLDTRHNKKEQRLLSIIGASGAGKSSLLHAGILPRLIRGELPGSEAWIILRTLCPGDQPLDNLVDVLYDHLPLEEKHENIKGTLAGSASGLSHLVHQIVRHAQPQNKRYIPTNTYVVLVIDQFEECLTQNNREECQKFIDLLYTAATRRDVPLLILMTCRADFYQELMGHHEFFELLRQHEVILNRAMTFSEMRSAIKEPLQKLDSSFHFEENLVDQIIADLQGQREALPLLQFTLFELFKHRQNFTLTKQAYREIHGTRGALAEHAEKIHHSFQGQQAIVRKLFLSLVKVSMSEDQEYIAARQRVDYDQLFPADKPANKVERLQLTEIIDAFVDARLLTLNHQNNQRTLEISHEILLQAWPRLTGWVHKNEEALYKKSRATQDARNWQHHSQPTKSLYSGQQLREIKELVKQNLIANDEPLRTFLHRSQVRQNLRYVQMTGIAFLIALILIPLISSALNLLLTPRNQIQVTSAADSGPGTLRDALSKAGPGETIVLDVDKIGRTTIILRHDLNFEAQDDNVTLRDNGVILTAPTGQQIHIIPEINVTFDHVLIENSGPAPDRAQGGVIFNQGQLRLISCEISGNSSDYNGGALVNTGILTLDDKTTFSHNVTTGFGGAIYNVDGYVGINNGSILKDNYALNGGGLYSQGGVVTIINSSILGNQAGKADGSRYFGGGLAFRNAKLNMRHSTIQANQVYGDGGGISLLDASANLNNSNITENLVIVTNPSDTPSWGGGGIAVDTTVAQGSPSQALIVNMSIDSQKPKIEGSIRDNFVRPSKNADATANVLGKTTNQGSLSIVPDQKNPVIVGYPPSEGAIPEGLSDNYVGNLSLNLFCQTRGYSQGDPTPGELAQITCISPLEATANKPLTTEYDAFQACKEQYNIGKDDVTARLYSYYDVSTWECYKDIKPRFSFTEQNIKTKLDNFCRDKYKTDGLYNNLSRTTAYDWECTNTDGNPIGISMADACRSITRDNRAFEILVKFNKPYGWQCWVPAKPAGH